MSASHDPNGRNDALGFAFVFDEAHIIALGNLSLELGGAPPAMEGEAVSEADFVLAVARLAATAGMLGALLSSHPDWGSPLRLLRLIQDASGAGVAMGRKAAESILRKADANAISEEQLRRLGGDDYRENLRVVAAGGEAPEEPEGVKPSETLH